MQKKLFAMIIAIAAMLTSFSFAENNYIQIEPFSEHLAAVQNENELWGYIDQTGELIIPCEWERAGAFTDGIASVRKNHRYGWINKQGEIVIPCDWNSYSTLMFSEGLAPIQNDEGLWGFIDKKGSIVVECKWEGVFAPFFSEGLAAVEMNEKMGYINKAGQIVIPCQYRTADSFSHGYARVQDDKGLFFINKQGEEAFPEIPRAVGIDSFREDCIAYIEFEDNTGVFIDLEGKIICRLPSEIKYRSNFREGLAGVAMKNENGNYIGCEGFIDRSGEIVIPLELYSSYQWFINGVTSIPDRQITALNKEIRYGVINHLGDLIYPFSLEKSVVFNEKVAEAIQGGYSGVINTDGNIVIPFEFNSVKVGDGFILCLKDGKISIFDYTGKLLKP